MSTGRPDPGVGGGRAENNNCLKGGCRGRKTSGVYQLEKNRRLSVALSPAPRRSARPLRGENWSAHTAGASSKIPFYISKSNSSESGPWGTKPHCEAPAGLGAPSPNPRTVVALTLLGGPPQAC